jgi:hypothetical protein
MAWWNRIFRRKARPSLDGRYYSVAFKLYSRDGRRQVEVRDFGKGETYLLERESADGTTFNDRHEGRLVGPFASPERAEEFIVATAWFRGCDE